LFVDFLGKITTAPSPRQSFTPTLSLLSGGSVTYTTQIGSYYVVGKMMFISITLVGTATPSAATFVRITGIGILFNNPVTGLLFPCLFQASGIGANNNKFSGYSLNSVTDFECLLQNLTVSGSNVLEVNTTVPTGAQAFTFYMQAALQLT
jgi:hypothetical protein